MVANQDLFDLFGDIVKSLPYLSVVIPFRNDDYSESALEKFNFSLKLLIGQLEENRITSEIVIVDWNSPDFENPLINEIRIKQNSEYVSVVVYEIDSSIHCKYRGHEVRNLVGEVAFNVGIRRSRGNFVVGKVSDTFYSSELISFIAQRRLVNEYVYRVDRVDVNSQFPVPKDWECHFKKNIVVRKSSPRGSIHVKACGDFLLMSKNKWFSIRGFPEVDSVVHHGSDGEALHAAIGAGARQEYLAPEACIYKLSHSGMYSSRVSARKMKGGTFKNAFLGEMDRNLAQKFIVVFVRLVLGLMNLPSTRISNIKTRSIYRYYLVANFRRVFWGGGFLKSDDWGLRDLALTPKCVTKANWED
jgi:hypothetical protein